MENSSIPNKSYIIIIFFFWNHNKVTIKSLFLDKYLISLKFDLKMCV